LRAVRIKEPASCSVFREWVYHLQADELAEADRETLLAHADACETCARTLEVEESLLRAVKARLVREEVPPGLRDRIRDSLRAESASSSTGWISWLTTPGASAVAATALLAALLVPLTIDSSGDAAGELSASKLRVVRPATIVDHDCGAAGRTFAEQLDCRNARHLNVLRVADGTYWNVNLDHPAARDIVLQPSQRGRRIVVEADFYPELHAVRLIRVRDPLPRQL
jgi:mycothiol system anti-sigma-R factor